MAEIPMKMECFLRKCFERELRNVATTLRKAAEETWSRAVEAIKLGSKKRTRYQNAAELDTLSAKYLYYFSYKATDAKKVDFYFFEFHNDAI